jgi:uncharacterized glyoxalase superfamily protein PhnB
VGGQQLARGLRERSGDAADIAVALKRHLSLYRHPAVELAIPILPVDDLDVARAFYVDRLGFDVRFDYRGEDTEGLLGLERGSIQITLDCPMTGHGREACVSLQVDSADAYYDEWCERVEIRRPPKNEVWGARTFDVIDPFGNTIFVMGPSTA